MKTKKQLKIILGVVLLAVVGLVSFNTFAHQKKEQPTSNQQEQVDVNITIDKNTSDDDLKDIKDLLTEHGITGKFSDISRNDLDELTAIKIELKDESGSQAVSQVSGNFPISEITFGRKNGQLYVGQHNKNLNMFAFFNNGSLIPPKMDMDSIFSNGQFALRQFNFDDFFNNDDHFKKLREQMNQFFDQDGHQKDPFAFFFDTPDESGQTTPRFKFFDDPETEKLIIIDGEEADFETLNRLANEDALESVDMLQPKTAMSLYGEKARDGAIIATTKR